jgi:hypothetical protein
MKIKYDKLLGKTLNKISSVAECYIIWLRVFHKTATALQFTLTISTMFSITYMNFNLCCSYHNLCPWICVCKTGCHALDTLTQHRHYLNFSAILNWRWPTTHFQLGPRPSMVALCYFQKMSLWLSPNVQIKIKNGKVVLNSLEGLARRMLSWPWHYFHVQHNPQPPSYLQDSGWVQPQSQYGT